MTPNLVLVLLYEPATSKGRPVPLAQVADQQLIVRVAEAALSEAQSRAAALAKTDELLGEVEVAEADRLRRVLEPLVPGLKRPLEMRYETVM